MSNSNLETYLRNSKTSLLCFQIRHMHTINHCMHTSHHKYIHKYHPYLLKQPIFSSTINQSLHHTQVEQQSFGTNASLHDTINRIESSFLSTNSALERSLMNSLLASKENYNSSANTYDGKGPKLFQCWFDDIIRCATISGITQTDIAISTSRGSLHKYVQELIISNTP